MRRTSLRVDRSILGSGQIEGRLLIELKNLDYEKTVKIATYTDVTPWYMRAFGHTMVTNQLDNEKALQHVRFIPAMQHGRPNMIVVKDLEIPPRQLYQIEIYFEKVFLHVSDFPPDADHPPRLSNHTAVHFPHPTKPTPLKTDLLKEIASNLK